MPTSLALCRDLRRPRLSNLRAALCKQCTKKRTVAAVLRFAVTTDRKIRRLRQRREYIERAACIGGGHLGAVFFCERRPLLGGRCAESELHRSDARRQIWKPYVVPILGCELKFRYPAWRTSYGSDSHAFIAMPFGSESNDADGHCSSPILGARSRSRAIVRGSEVFCLTKQSTSPNTVAHEATRLTKRSSSRNQVPHEQRGSRILERRCIDHSATDEP